uniref:Uncharacterized protein n=1 Tax=Cacopsylla melanoneura TaxID=428564 RepID=A0A8D8TRA6_9HEMI
MVQVKFSTFRDKWTSLYLGLRMLKLGAYNKIWANKMVLSLWVLRKIQYLFRILEIFEFINRFMLLTIFYYYLNFVIFYLTDIYQRRVFSPDSNFSSCESKKIHDT